MITISERLLKKWRRDALTKHYDDRKVEKDSIEHILINENEILKVRILSLTQKLLDLHLINKV